MSDFWQGQKQLVAGEAGESQGEWIECLRNWDSE